MELITTLVKQKEISLNTIKFPFFVLEDHKCFECGNYFTDLRNAEHVEYVGTCLYCWEVNHK